MLELIGISLEDALKFGELGALVLVVGWNMFFSWKMIKSKDRDRDRLIDIISNNTATLNRVITQLDKLEQFERDYRRI